MVISTKATFAEHPIGGCLILWPKARKLISLPKTHHALLTSHSISEVTINSLGYNTRLFNRKANLEGLDNI